MKVGSKNCNGRVEAKWIELEKGHVRIEIRSSKRLINTVELAVKSITICG